MKRKMFACLLALSLCFGLSVPALAAGPFTDVPPGYWAYEAILRVSDDSQYPATFNGTSATTFSPEGSITRAQLIAALNRSMNNEYWANMEGPIPYKDVPADAYYLKAMIWAKEEGILPDWLIGQDKIYPNTPLTRAEFCVILRNFDRWDLGRDLSEMASLYLGVFTDMDDEDLGENAQEIRSAMLGWGYHLYIINGTGDHTMSPNALVTQAQAAVMITRYWDSPKGKDQLFTDERRPDPDSTQEPAIQPPSEESGAADQADYVSEVLRLVNEVRQQEGLSPLQTNSDIQGAAQVRAEELATLFDHTRPNGRPCYTALDEAGISYWTAGENIATGYATPQQVVEGWLNSPPHRANILNSSFTTIGIGYHAAGNYWVQLFIA